LQRKVRDQCVVFVYVPLAMGTRLNVPVTSGGEPGRGVFLKLAIGVFPFAQAAMSNLFTIGPPSEIPDHPVPLPVTSPMKSPVALTGSAIPKL